MSDGVYLSAAALGAVSRDEVVPGFAQEVMRALSFRGTEAALRRTARQRLEGAAPGTKLARSLEEDFEVFTAMPAWRHVKIETKRAMLELRARLTTPGGRRGHHRRLRCAQRSTRCWPCWKPPASSSPGDC